MKGPAPAPPKAALSPGASLSRKASLSPPNGKGRTHPALQPLKIAPEARRGSLDEILDLDVFLQFDYSQAEVRILAELSQDPLLIQQFNSGADIHSMVGSTLTGWSPERIKAEKTTRKMVKNMIFGTVYGIGRGNLYDYIVGKIIEIDGKDADLSGISKPKVGKLYDKFFRTYAGVANFIEESREYVQKHGFSKTYFDFRIPILQFEESRSTYWLNRAINSPIQSSAHQLVLIAMALLELKPKTYHLLQRPSMEVHDALYFFVKLRHLQEAFQQGSHLLQKGVFDYIETHFKKKFSIPFLAEASAGFTIASLTDYSGESPKEFLPVWRKKYHEVSAKAVQELQKAT